MGWTHTATLALCLGSGALGVLGGPVDAPSLQDGLEEPDWYSLPESTANLPYIVPTDAQVWTDVQQGDASAQLCTYDAGTCKTDIGWLVAASGLTKEEAQDPSFNYMMRYQLQGACYMATVYSVNENAQYCNVWYLDEDTETQAQYKVNTTDICYTVLVWVRNPYTQLDELKKWGCSHLLPGDLPEPWAERRNWYDCEALHPAGGPARDKCRYDAFDTSTGISGAVLRQMLHVIKREPNYCQLLWDRIASKPSETSRKDFCEQDVDAEARIFLRNSANFRSTPEDPASLLPGYTHVEEAPSGRPAAPVAGGSADALGGHGSGYAMGGHGSGYAMGGHGSGYALGGHGSGNALGGHSSGYDPEARVVGGYEGSGNALGGDASRMRRPRDGSRRARDDGARTRNEEARVRDDGARTRDEEARVRDDGARTRDDGARVRNEEARVRDSERGPRDEMTR